jgi:signal peptidase I
MKSRTKRVWINILSATVVSLTMLLSFFAIVVLSLNIVYVKTYVRGYSMQPTLNKNITDPNIDGDLIYVNKFKPLENNDVIVANVSWYAEPIIKRLIGKPGDTIEIKEVNNEYHLLVNNTFVYSREKTTSSPHGISGGTQEDFARYNNILSNPDWANNVITREDNSKCIILNDDEYFVMGDNWAESTDSLTHGPIHKSNIVGRVELIIEPNENRLVKLTQFIFNGLFS